MSQTHDENMGVSHLSAKTYITGFILAVVLTLISFGVVMLKGSLSKDLVFVTLAVAAVLQMLVHLHYFLHLSKASEQRWNVIAIVFTAILIFIFVAGTMWVMYTLNSRMM